MSTHDVLKVRVCKQPGCEELADKITGPYGLLCRHHAAEARQAKQAGRNGGPPATRPNGQSFEFKAAALVELGRRVDAARAAYEPARLELEEATRRWQEAIGRLPDPNHGGSPTD
jgi:hypothetical protein